MALAIARVSLLAGMAAATYAQEDPENLLLRVRERVLNTVDRLPGYMCTQTIDRTVSVPVKKVAERACDQAGAARNMKLSYSDRLRLDVAAVTAGEIYSWVAENRFDDRSLLDLVKDGSISTGEFESFLASVFRNEGTTFSYRGDTSENGRRFAEYGFRVSLDKSRYFFGRPPNRVLTAYYGALLADAKTADIVRMTVRTDELPAETGACDSTTTLEYGRTRLRNADFLLPTEARLHTCGRDGVEADNRTRFSGCQQFLGESTLEFGPPRESGSAPGRRGNVPALSVPQGLRFRVALAEDIDAAKAAAGDPISARLVTAIEDDAHNRLVDVGTRVNGRILQVRYDYTIPALTVLYQLETIEIDGVRRPFTAVTHTTVPPLDARKRALRQTLELGTLPDVLQRRGVARLRFSGAKPNYVVKSGLESNWLTGTGER